MAKATNPRKPAGEKRKGAAAAKRRGGKRGSGARKVTRRAVHARRPERGVKRRASARGQRIGQRAVQVREAQPVSPQPDVPREPPPLPVPIASFTF